MQKVDFESLTISDDFLFSKVMEDEDICKKVIEIILNKKIEKIEYLERQKNIDIIHEKKSVRLDVYVRGDEKIYNIEMQVLNNADLIKRTRYYQGLIDLNQIEKGTYYRDLKDSYIIFICCFDPFNLGYSKYEFENICVLEKGKEILKLEDGSYKIFLNSKGYEKEANEELKAFLRYVNSNSLSDIDFIKMLDKRLEQIKKSEEWRLEYMTLQMKLDERYYSGYEKGMKKGIEEGIEKGIEKGMEKGIEEGIEKGIEKGIMSSIKVMFNNNLSVEMIAKYLNLQVEEVKRYLSLN